MPNKYNFDTNIFKSLTAESSWALGWILADGCICNKRLSIGLSSKDEEVLYKIKEVIKYDGPISRSTIVRNGKEFYGSRLAIHNEDLVNKLIKYNATSNKSLTLEYPELIEWKHMRHFIRGFFEGDGSVKYNKKRNCICINFKGTYEFLKRLKINLRKCLEIKGSIYRSNNTNENVYNYDISGNKMAVMFLNWIYYNSEENTRLNRKYERSKELYKLMIQTRKTPVEINLAI